MTTEQEAMVRQRFFSAWAAVLMLVCLGASRPVAAQTNLVAATIGTNQFKTIQEAINATPQNASPTNPCLVYVKPGVYKELIHVQHEKRYFHLLSENAEKTVLTYDLNAKLLGVDSKP